MSIKSFITLFKNEYDEYYKLLSKAQEKQEAILQNDIERLAEVVSKEQEILSAIEELEVERLACLKRIAVDNNRTEEEVTFRFFLEHLPEEKKELKGLKKDFLYLLKEIEKVNDTNRQLIQDSLLVNDFTLKLIRQAVENKGTYSKDVKANAKVKHIIDRKA